MHVDWHIPVLYPTLWQEGRRKRHFLDTKVLLSRLSQLQGYPNAGSDTNTIASRGYVEDTTTQWMLPKPIFNMN